MASARQKRVAWEAPRGTPSWAAPENTRWNGAEGGRWGDLWFLGGFGRSEDGKGAPGSTRWGGWGHGQHRRCCLRFAGDRAFPGLGHHWGKAAGPEIGTCVPQFPVSVVGPKFCIPSHPQCLHKITLKKHPYKDALFFSTGDDNILLALPTNFYLDFRQNNLQDITLIDCENAEFILTFLPSENIL